MDLGPYAGGFGQGEREACVPPGARVYAIGDSHGCARQLHELRGAILEDSAKAADAGAGRRVVVYLGDYIDRGPDSRGLIDLLIEEPLPGFESVHLMGNHDRFMTRFLEGRDDPEMWAMNGGEATWLSYGVEGRAPRGTPDPAAWLRAELASRVPREHVAFLSGLRLSHVEGDYFFVHAGIRPGVALEKQDPEDLLWIRGQFLESNADHGKVVVHGHSPSPEPELRANRIGIDTGACYGGPLTALVLEGAAHRFLQA